MKLKNSNCDKTQKHKLWQNSITQIVIKLNSNGDKTQKLNLWQLKKSKCDKTQLVTKLNMWQNSTCDKTPILTKLKLWQNSSCDKTQIVTKLKLREKRKKKIKCYKSDIVTVLTVVTKKTFFTIFFGKFFSTAKKISQKNSNSNSNCDESQNLKLW